MDVLTKEQRSYNMSQIRGRDTKPELLLRKKLYKEKIVGYRVNYNLIGKPDIAFTKYKIVIFIDGCFWHKCPEHYKAPKTNKKFWNEKILKNTIRDKVVTRELENEGWKVLRFFEHEVKREYLDKTFKIIVKELKKAGYS